MTDTRDLTKIDAAIQDALSRIDGELPALIHRDLVSTDEMTDLLLDVRALLAPALAGGDEATPVG